MQTFLPVLFIIIGPVLQIKPWRGQRGYPIRETLAEVSVLLLT